MSEELDPLKVHDHDPGIYRRAVEDYARSTPAQASTAANNAGLPRVTVRVARRHELHNRATIHREEDRHDQAPALGLDAKVRLGVGAGLTLAELPALAQFAAEFRHVRHVEIVGLTRPAVNATRRALLRLWSITPDTPGEGRQTRAK